MLANCDVCEKEFIVVGRRQKRCSEACRLKKQKQIRDAKEKKKMNCLHPECDKQFVRRFSSEKYCSRSCSAKHRELKKQKQKKHNGYKPLPVDTEGELLRFKNKFILRGAA